ncbi:ATP-dependent DNA helicase, partial [Trichostrongylus colubriformis]
MVFPLVAERPVAPSVAIDYDEHGRNGLLRYESFNVNRKAAVDDIMDALDRSQNRCIFIDCPGGSGQTYSYNTVYDKAVGKGRQVACGAWTGIAANFLPKEQTANFLFKLNPADSNPTA